MLVLNRHIDEVICINDDVRVQVLGIQGNQVKLGIEAPSDVAIYREEIYRKLKAERFRALKLRELQDSEDVDDDQAIEDVA